MNKLKLVTYCGLYCGLCAQRGRIPQQARVLKQAMVAEGYEFWGKWVKGFTPFWKFLNNVCEPDKSCPGCRQGGGPPFCAIRKCARKRRVKFCLECKEYPCNYILGIAQGYPTLLADGARLKKYGLNKWLKEQVKRMHTGFNYADIRYHPYIVSHK